MLFNSLEFLAFFAIVYGLYRTLPFRGQNWMLLVAGYVFYGWWDVRFLFLIAFSTTVDFWIGLMLAEGRVPIRQRRIASTFLIGAAFAFLCIDWSGVYQGLFFGHGVQRVWASGGVAWLTLLGTVIFVAVANVAHSHIVQMAPEPRRRLLLFLTVFVNLTFLGVFKYFNFFIDSAESMLTSLGWNASLFHLRVVLPVGISFYTFQSLSYTLDASRGQVKPTDRFWDFALFVAYFPPMVAGPIERARHLLPQLQRPRLIRLDQTMHGVVLVLFGLFKKVAIADGLAPSVNAIFNSSGAVSATDVALATLLFAIQIFCDFSGYSDIARGVSKMLGIELMLNFNLPYFSRNPSEFWERWHISLSSWLRDYLYISLGGNRRGRARTYVNLMATMTLGGLWHGAAWNYVLWGLYQGALLCGHRFFTGGRKRSPAGPATRSGALNAFKIAFFFLFVCYGWLLFRANSGSQILQFTQTLMGFGPAVASVIPRPPLVALLGMVLLVGMQFAEYLDGRREFFRHWASPVQGALYAVALLLLTMGMSNAPVQFIYFQF
jgi:D-alanyl-lipoteichoic acid acyltransferase DltB (MBOAT superfamily)